MSVGAFAKATANLLNSSASSDPDLPLITVSNHMSTLDDPVMWAFKGFPIGDAKFARCSTHLLQNLPLYFFRLGKCIPITRGGGIYQEHMNEALDRLRGGEWVRSFNRFLLHTFPEGKVFQEDAPIRRLKWGTASLIARAPVTPIVLPIVHHGFEKVMPENYLFGRRPPFPLCNKKIQITVGEPIEFDIPKMKQNAISASKDLSFPSSGWPRTTPCGLDEAAQRYLYTTISEHIRTVMEKLRNLGKALTKSNV